MVKKDRTGGRLIATLIQLKGEFKAKIIIALNEH